MQLVVALPANPHLDPDWRECRNCSRAK
jgi:hypothetical protein